MSKNLNIGERIKGLRLHLGKTTAVMGEELGTVQSSYSKIERGELRPSAEMLAEIVARWGVSAKWLLTGEGEMFGTQAMTIEEIPASGERNTVPIPCYNNVRVSAGYGIEIFNEEPDSIYEMPEKFFNGIGIKNLNCIRVSGDSMAPRFDDGDWIFITLAQEVRSEGIYVIRVRGTLLVKKVQWLPDGLRLISENKDYPPVLLNEDTCPAEEVGIIGKVVLIVSKP